MGIKENLERVQDRIAEVATSVGREPEEITLVAVTKTLPAEIISEAYEYGIRVIGENRAQEALKKWEVLQDLPLEWHFIGYLQTNKVKYVLRFASMIQSVDRKELVDELRKRLEATGHTIDVLIEVNTSGEATKAGVKPDRAGELLDYILDSPCLNVRGFMTMAPFTDDERVVRECFAKLRKLRDKLQDEFCVPLKELSMGMSSDYHLAIMEGATMVRIGTAIFGPRME